MKKNKEKRTVVKQGLLGGRAYFTAIFSVVSQFAFRALAAVVETRAVWHLFQHVLRRHATVQWVTGIIIC